MRKTVLVLSADYQDSKILSGLAAHPGWVVWLAESCDEAMKLVCEWGVPDVVLYSTGLPGGPGEFVNSVRRDSPDVLLVACPSEGDEDFRTNDLVLARPFGMDKMMSVVCSEGVGR